MRQLEQRGYPVWRVRGYAAIDLARNQMASDALAKGFDELMWIDADIGFRADDVERLRRHPHPCVAGLYPMKGVRRLAASLLPGTRQIHFGKQGGLLEVRYVGFGFVLTRRTAFERIRQELHLPTCNERFGKALIPWFAPMVHDDGSGNWYLSEDYAFCERARQVGISIMIDSSLRLWHVGSHAFSWEDAGNDIQRFGDYTYHFNDAAPPPAQPTAPATASTATPPTAPASARPPRNALHDAVGSLPASFPRFRAYCVSYPANQPSLHETLNDFRRSDWGEEPIVFMQPDDWPTGKPSASRNYRRALEHAYEDGCDFALILEDDVRVNRWLRHNLTTNPLLRRDQCDYLSLFMPDLIVSPWERHERHLGYRLAKPLYSGPNQMWERYRLSCPVAGAPG
ncbi:MAG TPA: hypothetical protein VN688_01250 [Gemmataceae bacterium]|nr:hypothetical protein [Gemmataceae bacterium]